MAQLSDTCPRFKMKHGDSDMLQILEQSSPPVDLEKISLFRTAAARYHRKSRYFNLNLFLIEPKAEDERLQAEESWLRHKSRKRLDWQASAASGRGEQQKDRDAGGD